MVVMLVANARICYGGYARCKCQFSLNHLPIRRATPRGSGDRDQVVVVLHLVPLDEQRVGRLVEVARKHLRRRTRAQQTRLPAGGSTDSASIDPCRSAPVG